ncbi:hypothetical protein O3G_MSEX008685 [Manduca sexta]|uniref:Uncharacterized protein n=1 Tax=Manduca sexta TaxID=7130 RepID=A0A922CPC9_MANSE|nr:hypothetical protein O3G_MSEX008685 [Manduca sexta]
MHIMGIFKFTLIVSALTLLVPDVSAYYRGGYGGYYNGFNVLGNGSPSFGGGYRQLGHNGIAYEAASGLSGIGHGGHTLSGLNTNLNNINRGIEGTYYRQNNLAHGAAPGLSGFGQNHYGLSGFGPGGHSLSGFRQRKHRLSGFGPGPFEQNDFRQYYRNGYRR